MIPSFSIIIVNFNYAAYLGVAIESALGQSLPASEVIVVDDYSTDDSRALIARYEGRVVACLHTANGGMSACANTGFFASHGDIVLFLDADDFLYPDALESIADAWRPGVVQTQARLDLVDADGRVEDVFPPLEVRFSSGNVRTLLANCGRYQTTVTTGLAFGRDALSHVMPIPEADFSRSADGYLATIVPLYGEVVSIERRIGAYRRHAKNHSSFSANIATRSRWRIDHDEKRYAALRVHGPRNGVAIAVTPGLNDPVHLEERLASLCFDPARHPYPDDSRGALGRYGVRAVLATGPVSAAGGKRRAAQAIIFLVASHAPPVFARTLLGWKMERASRPRWVDQFSGWLRRRLK